MSDVLIISAPNGQLSRRAIDFIRYAPIGFRISVKPMNDNIAGHSIDSAIIDDLLAELTGDKDD